jgi:hypothetical protein
MPELVRTHNSRERQSDNKDKEDSELQVGGIQSITKVPGSKLQGGRADEEQGSMDFRDCVFFLMVLLTIAAVSVIEAPIVTTSLTPADPRPLKIFSLSSRYPPSSCRFPTPRSRDLRASSSEHAPGLLRWHSGQELGRADSFSDHCCRAAMSPELGRQC